MLRPSICRTIAVILTTALPCVFVLGQTYTSCNPLESSSCGVDAALGMSIAVDFRRGEVNSFTARGGTPSYGPNGVTFTVADAGDSPQLVSVFYIMFGRVEIDVRAAPGAGIVSSVVLESDCLDEIDLEWLGADADEVQTNYFGKGVTATYNRGRFHPAAASQADFVRYSVDWTAERIVWSVGSTVVRTLLRTDAAPGQYPQTPMRLKFGAWAAGDASNPPGTVEWSRGPTNYKRGPFSMAVRSVLVTDYSTGQSYTYADRSGRWESIVANGGAVNRNLPVVADPTLTTTLTVTARTGSPTIPAGIGSHTADSRPKGTIPDGWHITSDGKIVPNHGSSPSSPDPLVLLAAVFLLAAAVL